LTTQTTDDTKATDEQTTVFEYTSTNASDDDHLSANRFDIDGGEIEADRQADQYADKVATLWGTPEGEWWP